MSINLEVPDLKLLVDLSVIRLLWLIETRAMQPAIPHRLRKPIVQGLVVVAGAAMDAWSSGVSSDAYSLDIGAYGLASDTVGVVVAVRAGSIGNAGVLVIVCPGVDITVTAGVMVTVTAGVVVTVLGNILQQVVGEQDPLHDVIGFTL